MKFTVKFKRISQSNNSEENFDNNGQGFKISGGVTYIELGKIPITVRYSDYDKMFRGVATIIVQYTEEPAEITVTINETGKSKKLELSGLPGYNDVGIFRI